MGNYDLLLQQLVAMYEIQAICFAAYISSIVLLIILLGIFLAHSAYVLTDSKILYVNRAPKHGWNKQFYPAIVLIALLVLAITWIFWQLSQGILPFAT